MCLLHLALRRAKPGSPEWADLGIALDVVLSFVLVALVIGFGLLAELPPTLLPVWSFAVVLNVLGAGISRLSSSVEALTAPGRRASSIR